MFDVYSKTDDETALLAVRAEYPIPPALAKDDDWRLLERTDALSASVIAEVQEAGHARFTASRMPPASSRHGTGASSTGLIGAVLVATAVAAAILVLLPRRAQARPRFEGWGRWRAPSRIAQMRRWH